MENIVYNLSNFKRKVYKCPTKMRRKVTINLDEEGYFRIEIEGDIVTFFQMSHQGTTVSASYSREGELPESIKFYNQNDNTFYCFENIKRVYEEAAYDEYEDEYDDE